MVLTDEEQRCANVWAKQQGLTWLMITGYRSFRRSAVACLENARVPQSEAAQVVGHERAGITFGTYNPEGMNLNALRDVVEKISYKGLAA